MSSGLIRRFIWRVMRAVLFRLEAETAHLATLFLIRMGIKLKNIPLVLLSGAKKLESASQSRVLWGIVFHSPVGLAAGFDKNAEIVAGLPSLGFGFAEIGTVTPRPQAGNEPPRLFRFPREESIFNRMGFNGLGATLVSEQLRRSRERLPSDFRIGVNLGKNKDTPLDRAFEDYARACRAFEGLADYMVINVSSPNTPGLRSLQTAESLKPIVSEVKHVMEGWRGNVPLLLKIAPELRGDELIQLVQSAEEWGVDGWVLTNTLGGELNLPPRSDRLAGGWSGKPLHKHALKSLKSVRGITTKPIISVGGILSVKDAEERIDAGAQLLQIYTGWVFRGPSFPTELAGHLLSKKALK